MASARSCAISAIVILFFTAIGLLLFACIHWRNGWSVFILLPYMLAIFVPSLCKNCTPLEQLDTSNIQWDEPTIRNCRELGWTLALILLVSAYGIPVLAWYNSGFACAGAAVVMVAQTALIWVYMLVVRLFGPLKDQ
jgi:uncharacterized membrane protein YhaH (DUF805 family)